MELKWMIDQAGEEWIDVDNGRERWNAREYLDEIFPSLCQHAQRKDSAGLFFHFETVKKEYTLKRNSFDPPVSLVKGHRAVETRLWIFSLQEKLALSADMLEKKIAERAGIVVATPPESKRKK